MQLPWDLEPQTHLNVGQWLENVGGWTLLFSMNFTAKDKKGKSSTCYLQCPGAAVGSLKVGGESQKSQGRHLGNAALQPVFQVSQQSSPRCLVSEVLA